MDLMKLMLGINIGKSVLSDAIDDVESALKSRLFYTIDVSNDHWDVHSGELRKHFRNLPDDTKDISNEVFSRDDLKDVSMPMLGSGDKYVDICVYERTPIVMTFQMKPSSENGFKSNGIIFKFMTIRTDKNITKLKKLIRVIFEKKKNVMRNARKPYITEIDTGSWNLDGYQLRNERSFDDVFIPNQIKDELVGSISNFIKKRDWYNNHRIPYHFGILLHGPAGTGKSSIIQAIMSIWKIHGLCIPSGDLGRAFSNPTRWRHVTYSEREDLPSLIISEDIDVDNFTAKRENDDGKEEGISTLGKVLNFMDGVNSPENVIYIFTTNHIEKLDPALIRPGRIDLCLEIGYVTDETMDAFLMSHFNKHLPDTRNVNDKLTFAKLQTEIMSGSTYGDIINEYTHAGET